MTPDIWLLFRLPIEADAAVCFATNLDVHSRYSYMNTELTDVSHSPSCLHITSGFLAKVENSELVLSGEKVSLTNSSWTNSLNSSAPFCPTSYKGFQSILFTGLLIMALWLQVRGGSRDDSEPLSPSAQSSPTPAHRGHITIDFLRFVHQI